MDGAPSGVWGKLRRTPGSPVERWHPLVAHCADVAACLEALLADAVIRSRLARLAGLRDLEAPQRARLCILAALHDAGKFNHGFQRKGALAPADVAGHVGELFGALAVPSPERAALVAALGLRDIDAWGASRLLVAALAHHGAPENVRNPSRPPRAALWRATEDRDPIAGIAALATTARSWYPAWREPAEPFPDRPPFQHAFSGLVTLADWIGSDEAAFPYAADPEADRMPFARERAQQVLRRLWVDPSAARAALRGVMPAFTDLFDVERPRPAQQAVLELAVAPEGGLSILEAETGSGKTEAAVARFVRLFAEGRVDGMYFALPTRTSATQIHRRLVDAMRRCFPDERERPPVVLAVPGYLRVDDLVGGRDPRLPPFAVCWPDDEQERMRWRGWAVEHGKRYLAGTVVVGTIDQILLSALPLKHAHLRAAALLRHFLVVDEVHASDAYMNRLLETVLERHLAAGGHALLMSATLGAAARERFVRSSADGSLPPLAACEEMRYPGISCRGAGTELADREPRPAGGPADSKPLAIEPVPILDEASAIAGMALDAARAGGRVLVIRNTVKGALAVQRELEARAGSRDRALLFECEGQAAPHHSRYAAPDRERLDRAIEAALGKRAGAGGRVVVATQTVQQSLDLDADLLLTDLCPADVLLQRAGRLHRHAVRKRPAGFERARVALLVPCDPDLGKYITARGDARGPQGIGTVYRDLRILQATWSFVGEHPEIEIPANNRAFVEAATHPEALGRVVARGGERWTLHARAVTGALLGEQVLATTNVFDWSRPLGDAAFGAGFDGLVKTRLGAGDRIARFDGGIPSPFAGSVEVLSIPAWFASGAGPDEVPREVNVSGPCVGFQFGGKRFVYDRLGLRPEAAAAPAHEEDAADA